MIGLNLSILERLFLETPYALCIGFAVLSVVLLIHSNRRRSSRLLIASVTTMAASVTIYTLSVVVVTDREQIIALTHEAVRLAAAKPFDATGLQNLIDPRASLIGPDGTAWLNFETIFAQLDRFGHADWVHEHTIDNLEAQLREEHRGLSHLDLRTVTESEWGRRRIKTRWRITWSLDANHQWRIVTIQWLTHPDPDGIEPTAGIWRQP